MWTWNSDPLRAFTVGLHPAAVQLDDAPDEREAHAESAQRVGRVRIELNEQVEHAVERLAFDALAVVAHLEHRLAVAWPCAQRESLPFAACISRRC